MTVARRAGTASDRPHSALIHRDIALVVDDDEQVLRLVKRVLERAGFECVTVSDGGGAHDAAVEWRPDIIVFLSVRDSLKDKVEHLLSGADDYVTKPFVPEELVARLRAVMSRSTTTRGLSPLTGMSGNSDILREISRRLAQNLRFATLYPDIDSFKSYNDHYGFLRGDDVIKTLATIILEVLEENPSGQHFAGHVGGDDFVVLTEPSMAETIATEITRRFDAAIPALYDPIDRDRGWIESEERNGSLLRTPLVSVSIGIVIAEPGTYSSAAAVAARASEVKGVAKRMPGSKWVLDRRRPPERYR